MKERYILALDQGTTSSRAILFNKSGVVIGQKQIAFKQIFPRPGWVEHDPEEIWASQLAAARGAIESAQIESDQVAAMGITNQRETTVVWERVYGQTPSITPSYGNAADPRKSATSCAPSASPT